MKSIAISISESEELNQLGFSDTHLKDAMIEFAKNLLIQNFKLVYGGDLRNGDYTEIFADLAYQYRLTEQQSPFINYFSYPIYLNLTKENRLFFKKNRIDTLRIEPSSELDITEKIYLKPDSKEKKYIWAKCLTKMRIEMNEAVQARILFGGKNFNYLGKYPGIIEEAFITLQSKKPVFLIGAFGGATKRMINAILSKGSVIDLNDSFYKDDAHTTFKGYFNQTSQTDKIDYESLNQYFKNLSIEDLNNGLSQEENKILFTSIHLTEIIFFVLKGLSRC